MAYGRKTGGRQKGTPNKVSYNIKDAVLKSFEAVGGWEYLKEVAQTDHKTYCALLARVLPSEVQAQISGESKVTIELVTYSGGSTIDGDVITRNSESLPSATLN